MDTDQFLGIKMAQQLSSALKNQFNLRGICYSFVHYHGSHVPLVVIDLIVIVEVDSVVGSGVVLVVAA